MSECKTCHRTSDIVDMSKCPFCYREWSGLNKVDETVYQVGCDTDNFTKSDFSSDRGVTDHAKRVGSNAK